MATLSLTILTPTGTTATLSDIDSVVANTTSGQITILPNHIPLLTRLEHGEMRVRSDKKEYFFTLFEGFLHLSPQNAITVMANAAQRSEELNVESIRKAKLAAEKALEEKERLSTTEILKAETAMRRAIMELKVAEKRVRRGF